MNNDHKSYDPEEKTAYEHLTDILKIKIDNVRMMAPYYEEQYRIRRQERQRIGYIQSEINRKRNGQRNIW